MVYLRERRKQCEWSSMSKGQVRGDGPYSFQWGEKDLLCNWALTRRGGRGYGTSPVLLAGRKSALFTAHSLWNLHHP